jgi:hypothetical protein
MTCIVCSESIRLRGTLSHSFRIIEREIKEERVNDNIIKIEYAWFYTNELEVVDRTPELIVNHIRNELREFHTVVHDHKNDPNETHKMWSWYYDAREFQMDLNAMDTFLRLLEIFVQYGSTLQQIRIKPNQMIKTMLQLVHMMLPETMRDMIFLEE